MSPQPPNAARKMSRDERSNEPLEDGGARSAEPFEPSGSASGRPPTQRRNERRERARFSVEKFVRSCSRENDLSPVRASARQELDFHGGSRPRQRSGVDATLQRLEAKGRIFWSAANDLASKLPLKLAKVWLVTSGAIEVQRDPERRSARSLRPTNRPSEKRRGVGATSGKDRHPFPSVQQPIEPLFDESTKREHGFLRCSEHLRFGASLVPWKSSERTERDTFVERAAHLDGRGIEKRRGEGIEIERRWPPPHRFG